jgi:hypothetical protein
MEVPHFLETLFSIQFLYYFTVYIFIFNQISLSFHLFSLNLTCSCPYSYNLMLTATYLCRHTDLEQDDCFPFILPSTEPFGIKVENRFNKNHCLNLYSF